MKLLQKTRCLELILLSILTLLAGCNGGQPSNVETGTQQQILHISNGDEPQDLDPHIVTGVSEHNIIHALMEGLVSKHPADLSAQPGVAESWEISEDGTVYTFYLHKTAKWSNNSPVTAKDFVYSWQRALLPGLGNQYAYMLYPVKNAEMFHKQDLLDFSQVGIQALDEHTLKVTLEHSTPYFLSLLDHYSTFPVHQATIESFGKADERGTAWTRPGNFVGNGPFTLSEWTPNKVISVEKNPLYWDSNTVRLKAIHFYPVQQNMLEERMFRSGQLHITHTVPTEKIAVYQKNNPELIQIHPYLGTYFYRLNTTVPPLDNVKVRQALAMSIDRSQIVNKVTKGGQTPAYNLTPPNTMGYTATAKTAFDPTKAKQLLAEAGYPNGQGFPKLELLYNTSESHRKIALAVQHMWKQTLNIDITLSNQDWKVFLSSQRTMNFQIARASWIGDYLDPNTFLDMFVTNGGNNSSGWSDTRYDNLIAQAAKTSNQATRHDIFQAAEKILMEAMPIIPVYTYTNISLISPDVKGWHPNILDQHPYKYVYLSSGQLPTEPGN